MIFFFGGGRGGPKTNPLHFGGNPVYSLDPGVVDLHRDLMDTKNKRIFVRFFVRVLGRLKSRDLTRRRIGTEGVKRIIIHHSSFMSLLQQMSNAFAVT